MSTESITVLIVEDHELTRSGLRLTLDALQEFVVVGEAQDGLTAIALTERFQPRVVLMDIGLPKLNGIECTKKIKEAWPDTKVIMLTSHNADDDIFAAFAAGADAYCTKEVSSSQLQLAVRAVADGASWLDPAIANRVFSHLPKQSAQYPGTQRPSGCEQPLTERENEVLALIAAGSTNQQIAAELIISVETVKSHVRRIMEKLSVSDRTQAAVKAIKQGLLV